MDAFWVRERYKVVRVIQVQEHYACVQAVDILDREVRSCLLNIYEGPLLKEQLPGFDQLRGCPAFLDMFLERGSLVTVFEDREGSRIDQVFYLGDKHPWRTRLDYAGQLMDQALNMADLPAPVSCAAMLSDNVLVEEKSGRLRFRFQVVPLEGMCPRELAYLTGDQLRKLLRPRFGSPREELELLEELERRDLPNVVALYALWRERRDGIQAAYEDLEGRTFLGRFFRQAWTYLKWRWSGGRGNRTWKN